MIHSANYQTRYLGSWKLQLCCRITQPDTRFSVHGSFSHLGEVLYQSLGFPVPDRDRSHLALRDVAPGVRHNASATEPIVDQYSPVGPIPMKLEVLRSL